MAGRCTLVQEVEESLAEKKKDNIFNTTSIKVERQPKIGTSLSKYEKNCQPKTPIVTTECFKVAQERTSHLIVKFKQHWSLYCTSW